MKSEIEKIVEKITILRSRKNVSEEGTKNYLVLPFVTYLGYDATDPTEIEYEYICDMHENGKRKVDCAIFDSTGSPYILIEVKSLDNDLFKHTGQLKMYFLSCVAKYAILTNGDEYIIYTREQIDGDFINKGPAHHFKLSALNEKHLEIFNNISKSNEIKEYLTLKTYINEKEMDAFELFCHRTSVNQLYGLPTNIAYKKYLDVCNEKQETPICLINWSKLIKKRFGLTIIDKRVDGVKRRVFLQSKN